MTSQSTTAFNSARRERPALRARQEALRCDTFGAVGFRRIWFLMRTIELTPKGRQWCMQQTLCVCPPSMLESLASFNGSTPQWIRSGH